jgi:hypothetical protein
MTIVKAERVDFNIAPGYAIEFYRLPTGEKRIGKGSAAKVCGLNHAYFQNLESRTPKRLEALRGMGFTGWSLEVSVDRNGISGASRSDTMSLEDFRIFVAFAAFQLAKKPAQAIATAMIGVAIETIAKQAFGEAGLSVAEIRALICDTYAKTVNWQAEDREDAETIEDHLLFLRVV